MKKLLTIVFTLTASLIFAGDVLYAPMVMLKSEFQDPTYKDNMKSILAYIKGYPETAEGKQAALDNLSYQIITNCVGNASVGIPAGSDVILATPPVKKWVGQDIASIQTKWAEAKSRVVSNAQLGEICDSKGLQLWIDYWGAKTQEEE